MILKAIHAGVGWVWLARLPEQEQMLRQENSCKFGLTIVGSA